MSAPLRALLGFIAAVISVLVFHQGMWGALHLAGLMPPAYPTRPIPPFGLPQIANLCFWGGLYGMVFGLAMPRFHTPPWLCGLGVGLLAVLVGLFIVPALKGVAFAAILGHLSVPGVMVGLAINLTWGLGLGLIAPLLMRRQAVPSSG